MQTCRLSEKIQLRETWWQCGCSGHHHEGELPGIKLGESGSCFLAHPGQRLIVPPYQGLL